MVYQLISNKVTAAQLNDPEKARLVHQCDIKDNLKRIVNYVHDLSINADLSVAQPSIATDSGMVLSFALSQDAFTQKAVINNKGFYFMAFSYACNNYLAYSSVSRTGQHQAYLQGRHHVKVTTALPHKVEPTFGGMVLNAQYGDKPQIVCHEGLGNGGAFLTLMPSTEAIILENGFAQNLRHQPGYGPINVIVVDPVHLVANNYTLSMYNSQPSDTTAINIRGKWFITYNNDLYTIFSQSNISNSDEQLLHDLYFNK